MNGIALAQYAMGLGWNLPLASLSNVENQLFGRNHSLIDSIPHAIVISAPPLDLYPVRERTCDKSERSGGTVDHEWRMALFTPALSFWRSAYFGAGTAVAATIYDRDEFGVYARYNVWAFYPSQSNGDIVIQPGQRGFCRLRQRFGDLTAI